MPKGGPTPPPRREWYLCPEADPAQTARNRRDEIALRILLKMLESEANPALGFAPVQHGLVDAAYDLADKMLDRAKERP